MEEERVIRLTREKCRRLAQLVFLGNYVVNGWRAPREELEEYDLLAEELCRAEYAFSTGIAAEDAEENEIADVRDRLSDEVCGHLEAFEKDVLREGACGERGCTVP